MNKKHKARLQVKAKRRGKPTLGSGGGLQPISDTAAYIRRLLERNASSSSPFEDLLGR